jgi:GABA(A) receptor-associated protein
MSSGRRVLAPGEAQRVMAKYPNKIPVVVEKAPGAQATLPDLPRWKYVVPRDLTMGQMMFLLRSHMSLAPEVAIFLFVGNTLPTSTTTVLEMWSRYQEADGALHIVYSGESAFGNADNASR